MKTARTGDQVGLGAILLDLEFYLQERHNVKLRKLFVKFSGRRWYATVKGLKGYRPVYFKVSGSQLDDLLVDLAWLAATGGLIWDDDRFP